MFIINLTTKLVANIRIKNIYLFGSYAKLIAHTKSDIDIAIVIEKRVPKIDFKIEKITEELEKRFGRKIQIHLFGENEFKRERALVKEILRDGIRII